MGINYLIPSSGLRQVQGALVPMGVARSPRLNSRTPEGTCVIPVIVATSLREILPEVLDAGATDFVTKPFHLTELLTGIRSILRVKHLTDELERACA